MCVVGKKYEKKVELNLIIVYREFNEMSWAGVCLIPHEYHSPTTSGFVIVVNKIIEQNKSFLVRM
jgi:hypothetical protein